MMADTSVTYDKATHTFFSVPSKEFHGSSSKILLLNSCWMSTAWYRANAIPKLVKAWSPSRNANSSDKANRSFLLDRLEVWDTTCIVTNFGKQCRRGKDESEGYALPDCTVLVNPGNPNLRGVSDFPYFPMGGPEPSKPAGKDAHHIMGYVTQWGGMEVGQGMLFSANVVDGLVHQLDDTRSMTEDLKAIGRCEEGSAVFTKIDPASQLFQQYSSVVHTVPPFYNKDEDDSLLRSCYRSALTTLIDHHPPSSSSNEIRVGIPLLGAGCRGFPVEDAIEAAAQTLVECFEVETGKGTSPSLTLAFAIPNGEVRRDLVKSIGFFYRSREGL